MHFNIMLQYNLPFLEGLIETSTMTPLQALRITLYPVPSTGLRVRESWIHTTGYP